LLLISACDKSTFLFGDIISVASSLIILIYITSYIIIIIFLHYRPFIRCKITLSTHNSRACIQNVEYEPEATQYSLRPPSRILLGRNKQSFVYLRQSLVCILPTRTIDWLQWLLHWKLKYEMLKQLKTLIFTI
jgi:hypothetical protein